MTRSTYNLHRIGAALFLPVILFAMANYYLDLGFFGPRGAKAFLILVMGVVLVYGIFFSPTREDVRRFKKIK